MRNYGVTVSDVLAAIKENRNAIAFWTRKEFPTIAQSHTDNIRDLRIMLLSIRFPENTFGLAYGEDFTPYIVTDTNDDSTNDDSTNDTIPESDRIAITDAITDNITEADKVSELISA